MKKTGLIPKKSSCSQYTLTRVMSPLDANHYGYVHGGAIMRYVDEAAFVSSTRHAGHNTVTANLDNLSFNHPVHIGDLLILKSSVNFVGKTSMEVGIRVETEDPTTGVSHYVGSAYVTMVALDNLGKPTEVAPLILSTPMEKERAKRAKQRADFRKKMRKKKS